MKWIILIGNQDLTLDKIKAIDHYGSLSCYDVGDIQNRYCVDYGADHIFYDYDEDSLEDYEEEDLSKIPFNDPSLIVMVYTSEERIKKVIQQNNFLNDVYVDNDHGLIVPIKEFIKRGMPLE